MSSIEENLKRLLEQRDAFIVSKGLWQEFVNSLSPSPRNWRKTGRFRWERSDGVFMIGPSVNDATIWRAYNKDSGLISRSIEADTPQSAMAKIDRLTQ